MKSACGSGEGYVQPGIENYTSMYFILCCERYVGQQARHPQFSDSIVFINKGKEYINLQLVFINLHTLRMIRWELCEN